jgi:hypothetical protein
VRFLPEPADRESESERPNLVEALQAERRARLQVADATDDELRRLAAWAGRRVHAGASGVFVPGLPERRNRPARSYRVRVVIPFG